METTIKTSVEIIQELLAIHTSRIEMVEKSDALELTEDVKTRLGSAKQQSEKYTKELMNELTHYGDAVKSGVDNQNEYQELYKSILGNIDTMTSPEAEQTFQSLENALKNIYQTILKSQNDLPDSLREMLSSQSNGIGSK